MLAMPQLQAACVKEQDTAQHLLVITYFAVCNVWEFVYRVVRVMHFLAPLLSRGRPRSPVLHIDKSYV